MFISDGLFAVELDFVETVFDGGTRWLRIGVRTDPDDPYVHVAPLQALTAVPYAFFALNGNEGAPGQDGSKWVVGQGAPAAAPGDDGDLYLDTVAGDLYQKTSGTWGIVANITGPVGPVGPAGPPGSSGGPLSSCEWIPIAHAGVGPRESFCPGNKVVNGVRADEGAANHALLTHLYCCNL